MTRSPVTVLDPQVLRELEGLGADLGQDVLGEVVKAFEETAPPLVEALLAAARERDVDAARRVAHTLRSASLQVGALELHELAKRIEAETQGGPESLAPLVDACIAELATVREALAQLRGR